MLNNKLPEFCGNKLDNLSQKLKYLCEAGYYEDIAYEVGCNYKDQPRVMHRKFFGSGAVKNKGNSVWRIYSMTKPVVSVVALALVDEGKLRLFDQAMQEAQHAYNLIPNKEYRELIHLINKEITR